MDYRDYGGNDIRAVESPYEATFELAQAANRSAKSTRRWLLLLHAFIIFYIGVTVATMVYNLLLTSDMRYLGIAMGFMNLATGIYSIMLLAASYRSSAGLLRDHGLLEKIDAAAPGGAASVGSGEAPKESAGRMPRDVLDRLIGSAVSDSGKLLGTFRYVFLFMVMWIANALIFFVIQVARFGSTFTNITIDWMAPGGTGLDAIIFIALSVYAYRKLNERFALMSARYAAIKYAMDRKPANVPEGPTAVERFRKYLSGTERYRDVPKIDGRGYFDGFLEHPEGNVLVKALARAPSMDDIAEFRSKVASAGGSIRHAVVIFPEEPEKPLSESVYDEVVHRPILIGKMMCTVELVMEGADGLYDFIPVVSP